MTRDAAVTFKGSPVTLAGPELMAGDAAPEFKCLDAGLAPVTLATVKPGVKLFSVVPSLDTPVCSTQTHTFEKRLAEFGDQVTSYTVSLDLPFAQKRFCTAEGVSATHTLSDVHDQSFGRAYGVLTEGLPLALLARAVFVVGADQKIVHAEYVAEMTSEPNYDAALAALRQATA